MFFFNLFRHRFVHSSLIRRILSYLLLFVAFSSCIYSIFFLYSFPSNTRHDQISIENSEEMLDIPDSLSKHVPRHLDTLRKHDYSSHRSLLKNSKSEPLKVQSDNSSIPDDSIPISPFPLPPLQLVRSEPVVGDWVREQSEQCGGAFEVRSSRLIRMRNVRLNPELAVGPRKGGEAVAAVINTPEDHEMFRYESGFFRLPCSTPPTVSLGRSHHIGAYLAASDFSNKPLEPYHLGIIDVNSVKQLENVAKHPVSLKPQQYRLVWTRPLLMVTRYEYVNLFHTMTDWYNTFLTMMALGLSAEEVNVLLVDAHPQGGLDEVWHSLFNEFVRVGNRSALAEPLLVRELVWVPAGYNSPLIEFSRDRVPLLAHWRRFFLARHGLAADEGPERPHCANLSVLFVWRRDYLAHPRNPSGHVNRKIANEAELMATARRELLPSARVRGEQLDALPMREQLRLVHDTDVLVGMHGAGLSHTLFLPRRAALIEFYPTYWSPDNAHFRKMAEWRGLHYARWVNNDQHLEQNRESSTIPPEVFLALLRNVLTKMGCRRPA